MKWSLPGYVLGPGARSPHTGALKEDLPPLSSAHAARSKKYRDLLSKLEGPAPSAIITIQRTGPAGADTAAASGPPAAPQRVLGHVSKPIGKPAPAATEEDEEGSVSDMSDDWETEDDASEAGEGAQQPEDWEEWNVCQSLFDGHVSASLEENLKYMYLNFGFYFPDTEFLVDPEGLMRYLVGCLKEGGGVRPGVRLRVATTIACPPPGTGAGDCMPHQEHSGPHAKTQIPTGSRRVPSCSMAGFRCTSLGRIRRPSSSGPCMPCG